MHLPHVYDDVVVADTHLHQPLRQRLLQDGTLFMKLWLTTMQILKTSPWTATLTGMMPTVIIRMVIV